MTQNAINCDQFNEITGKLNIVGINVRTVSGSITRDINIGPNTIASTEAFTNGSVKYVDSSCLNPFTTARQAANRACRNRGVRLLNAVAVADEELTSLLEELSLLKNEFEIKKTNLVANWQTEKENWELGHPEIAPWKSRFPTAVDIDTKTQFSVSVYKISAAEIEQTELMIKSGISTGLIDEIGNLPYQILEEIAQDVDESWNRASDKISQRIITGLLTRVSQKCRSLSFINASVLGEIPKLITDVISRLPTDGAIKGNDYIFLSGLLAILSDPQKMIDTAKAMAAQVNVVDDLLVKQNTAEDSIVPEFSSIPTSLLTTNNAVLAETPSSDISEEAVSSSAQTDEIENVALVAPIDDSSLLLSTAASAQSVKPAKAWGNW